MGKMDSECKNNSRLPGRVNKELSLVALKSSVKELFNTIAQVGWRGFILENLEGKKPALDRHGKITVSPWMGDLMKAEIWKHAGSGIQKDFRGGRKQETLKVGFSNPDRYKSL